MGEKSNLARSLDQARDIMGKGSCDERVPTEIYEFLRRFGPMICADVVVIPDTPSPSVILAQRDDTSVASNQYWIFGGRVDKHLNFDKVAKDKVESEIGLSIDVGLRDIIGLGRTIFPPDPAQALIRDYTVSTPNVVFATKVQWNNHVKATLKPADGHQKWRLFTELQPDWHPYVVHAVAHAWDMFYQDSWKTSITPKLKEILRDNSSFIPLRYHSLNI